MIVEFYGRKYKDNAKIPLEVFELWEKRAVAEINRVTARNLSAEDDENVKMCICEVAEFLYEESRRSGIESENNDGYSVKYKDCDKDAEVYNIIKIWLSKTELLFRGDVV